MYESPSLVLDLIKDDVTYHILFVLYTWFCYFIVLHHFHPKKKKQWVKNFYCLINLSYDNSLVVWVLY